MLSWSFSISFAYYVVHFFNVSGGSASLRYQLVRCYKFSKTSVLFRYQLWRVCDVLSWSVLFRYQLVHRDDVSNWSILFMYPWDVAQMSQIGPSHWHTNFHVLMMPQHGPRCPDLWDQNEMSLRRCMLSGSLVCHYFSLVCHLFHKFVTFRHFFSQVCCFFQ